MSDRTIMRRIQPLPMPATITPATELGPRPELRWVAPTSLMVDSTYQRDLSGKSIRLIRGMVERFAWSRMKPPIVVTVGDELHVVDGQHTAIAAATLKLPEIPIFCVVAGDLYERARAFVGHNTDRITVTPIAIHKALVATGDPDEQDVANVCRRAGVRIRHLTMTCVAAEGDTMAIATVRSLVKRRGVQKARLVLECLVKARRAPISADEIRAAEMLLCEQDRMPEEVTQAVRIAGDKGLNDARGRARVERVPVFHVLADRWRRTLNGVAA